MNRSQKEAFLARLLKDLKSERNSSVAGISVQSLGSGTPEIDWVIGTGGLPLGRIVELFGAEGTWKSTIALRAVASLQKRGEECFYLDSERKFDPEYARFLGVDTSRMTPYCHSTAEYALEEIEKRLLTQAPRLVVIDSLSGLIPKICWEDLQASGGMEAFDLAIEPHIRRIAALVAETQTTVLVISQLRNRSQVVFGPTHESYAGRVLRHQASVRIELKRTLPIKRNGFVIGDTVQARAVKNQVGSPWREIEIRFEHRDVGQRVTDREQLRSKSGLALEDSDIDWLSAVGTLREIGAGEILIDEGRQIESIYVVIKGAFSVRTSLAGDREVAKLMSGEVVGEMSFVDQVPTSATVRALGRSLVLDIPRCRLDSRLAADSDFAARFNRALSKCLAVRLRQTMSRLAGPAPEENESKTASDEHSSVSMWGRLAVAVGL